MAIRLVINLDPEERYALNTLAERDLRNPREQIRYILRKEFEQHGLLELTRGLDGNPTVSSRDEKNIS